MINDQIIGQHSKIKLMFSAGKDSLACLLLLARYLDKIDVVWVNPGSPHDEVLAYMQLIASKVPSFIEVKGNQPEWVRRNGFPVDVVPARSTPDGKVCAGASGITFQPFTACCAANLWAPIRDHINDSGATLVIMGQRKAEPLRCHTRDEETQVINGVTYWQPINDWSDSDVFAFIEACGSALPPFYAEGAESSADCWNCTAYVDHNQGRLRYMKEAQPEKWSVIEPIFIALDNAIRNQSMPMQQLLSGG